MKQTTNESAPRSIDDDFVNYLPSMPQFSDQNIRLERLLKKTFRRRGTLRFEKLE